MTPRDAEAKAILAQNDRGRFSVPTKGLYPFQWNWDSAFSALGYAHVSAERAVEELETLAASQWADGMIPHIIFHNRDDGYFPGPDVWQSGTTPPTSGITQPPVLAIAMERLVARGMLGAERLGPLLDVADRWHAWFEVARQDPASGAIGVVHPWESGRDNMPDWDDALAAVNADNVTPFTRRDLGHVDASMRPTQAQYNRYIALVEFGRGIEWDQSQMPARSPFFVADPGMTAILASADRALAGLAEDHGRHDVAGRARERSSRVREGLESLWSDEVGAYTSRNCRTGARGEGISSAAFIAFLAGDVPAARADTLRQTFDRLGERCRYMVPSYDPASAVFDEKRYWRGPVWLVVNWLVAMGLEHVGDTARAERVRSDSRALVEKSGFYEYFSPLDGAGLGGADFTWTAAAWLDFARKNGAH
ncbi:MAG: hypothetical protein AAF615_01420 [Pseudomonadota bacterium]